MSDDRAARLLHHRALSPGDPLAPPIVPASTYYTPGEPTAPHQYGRWTNPTWTETEDALATLEDAPCVAFPSGMAAIAAILFARLRPGDRLVLPADGYYATRALAETYLVPAGIAVTPIPTDQLDTHDLTGTTLVLAETPSNPGLALCDLRALVARARAAGALLVVDNTTATPFGQRPLDLGADAVVAADTKAPSGHADVLFGHVASRDPALLDAVRLWRRLSGAIPGPFEAWLVHRGLETLEVRFDRMCRTAQTVADRLAEHPAVAVTYPGLETHPRHALARAQMTRFGSILGLTFASAEAAERFLAAARLIATATSFGGVHSTAERRARWGDQVAPGYVRLSIGCEPTETLWTDIQEALKTCV